VFALIAALVIGANALMVVHYGRWTGSAVPEWPVAVDLLVVLPLVYLWLYRRAGRRANVGALLVPIPLAGSSAKKSVKAASPRAIDGNGQAVRAFATRTAKRHLR